MVFAILMGLLGVLFVFFAISVGFTVYLFKSKNPYFQEIFANILKGGFYYGGGGSSSNGSNSSAKSRSSALSYEEAIEILGVQHGADKKTINKAYQRLMQSVHPDRGGSEYFAKKLTEAREVAMQRAA